MFPFCLGLVFYRSVGAARADDAPSEPLVRKTIFGVLLHDRGPFSDRHENGVDPNWELQFNPPKGSAWRWLGSPDPMIGVTANSTGDTSVLYAGLSYELSLSNRWTDDLTLNLTKHLFVGASLSLALHDGPLHKNNYGWEERSDCGFGYRALPRLGFELGGTFRRNMGYRFSTIICRTSIYCRGRTKASITSAFVITFCSIADDDCGGSLLFAGT